MTNEEYVQRTEELAGFTAALLIEATIRLLAQARSEGMDFAEIEADARANGAEDDDIVSLQAAWEMGF